VCLCWPCPPPPQVTDRLGDALDVLCEAPAHDPDLDPLDDAALVRGAPRVTRWCGVTPAWVIVSFESNNPMRPTPVSDRALPLWPFVPCACSLAQAMGTLSLKSGETSGTGDIYSSDNSGSGSDEDDSPALPVRTTGFSTAALRGVTSPTVQHNPRYCPESLSSVVTASALAAWRVGWEWEWVAFALPPPPAPLLLSVVTMALSGAPLRVCRLGLRYGMAEEWGNRKTMEDRMTAIADVSFGVRWEGVVVCVGRVWGWGWGCV
jgi:hypothetical protein